MGQAAELAATRWPWLGPLFWPAVCPQLAPDDPWRGFALCAEDGNVQPVADALAAAATVPAVLPPGEHAVDHPALRYDSGWRVTSVAADPSADGDALTYDFTGTETALRVQGGPYWAYYLVSVDGQPANALPRDESGASYLVLYDPLSEEQLIALAAGLAPGQHRVRLEARGGWGQWALRGIRVADDTAGASSLPDWRILVLAAVLLVVMCLVVAWPELKRGACWLAARLDAPVRLPDAAWLGAAALLALRPWSFPLADFGHCSVGGAWSHLFHPARCLSAAHRVLHSSRPRPKALIGPEFSLYESLAVVGYRGCAGALAGVVGSRSGRRDHRVSRCMVSTGRFSRSLSLAWRRRWPPSDRM